MAISRVSIFVVCFLALFASIFASESSSDVASESKEFVLTLDHSNFSDTIAKHVSLSLNSMLLGTCGHCKNLAPEYEKAASILSSHDPAIVLAKVDANEDITRNLLLNMMLRVGIFPELSGEAYTSFTALAEKLRSDYEFGHTTDAKLLQGDFDVAAMEKFVEESSIPTVTIFSKDPANHPYVIKFFNSPNAKVYVSICCKSWMEIFL
ncbi:Protein disulfide isomerase-like 1-2, partial [Bienertia sinuspersici]